jgi:phospholipase/lecithinase/hemolysin
MKHFVTRYKIIATWVALVSLGIQGSAWAADVHIERIFIFGDSLSDPGNVYQLTGETSQPPYAIIPSRPYDFQGFQFSNGRTWAQWFARHLELKRSGKAALEWPGRFGNYAFGGARARLTDDPFRSPSSREQFERYLNDYNGNVFPDALYVIQFGGNDVRDGLEKFLAVLAERVPPGQEPTTDDVNAALFQASLIIQPAVETLIGLIAELHGLGARHFLVATSPDLGLTPAVRFAGPEAAAIASMMAGSYNDGLETGLAALRALPGISINTLDLFSILGAIVEDPKAFGIRNTDTPCLIFMVETGAVCRRPNKYLFWDGIHPTARVHKIVSEIAAELYD